MLSSIFRWIGTIAGGLISAFAGRLPDALQDLGLVVGLSLLGITLLITAWQWRHRVTMDYIYVGCLAFVLLFVAIMLGTKLYEIRTTDPSKRTASHDADLRQQAATNQLSETALNKVASLENRFTDFERRLSEHSHAPETARDAQLPGELVNAIRRGEAAFRFERTKLQLADFLAKEELIQKMGSQVSLQIKNQPARPSPGFGWQRSRGHWMGQIAELQRLCAGYLSEDVKLISEIPPAWNPHAPVPGEEDIADERVRHEYRVFHEEHRQVEVKLRSIKQRFEDAVTAATNEVKANLA